MKPEHADRWRQLLSSPDLTLRSQLIVAKRCARHLGAVLEGEMSGKRAGWTKKQSAAKISAVRQETGRFGENRPARFCAARRQIVCDTRQALAEIGHWICVNDVQLTRLNGIEGICDLLEVNPVHRWEVKASACCESRAIEAAAFVCGIEGSASSQSGRHPADCKEGPLFSALFEFAKRGGVVEA